MAVHAHPVLGTPIDVRPILPPERARLLDLLDGLDDGDWTSPTPCPGWSVQDLTAHVLGDDVGRLARTRDGFVGLAPTAGEALPEFLDRINHEWVVAARRMSPKLLIASLAWTGEQIVALWGDMAFDDLGEPVSWAGPDPAPVWLDAARDLTEYWVHRQQLRLAVGADDPEDPAILHTVLDTFMRALPHTLRSTPRAPGTAFSFVVPGSAGGTWTVERDADGWRLAEGAVASNTVVLGAEDTWRLCVRMVEPAQAEHRAEISGDHDLGRAALRILSIIRSG